MMWSHTSPYISKRGLDIFFLILWVFVGCPEKFVNILT